MSDSISLKGPRTVTLSAETIALSIDALSELPFKKANPAILEWFSQLRQEVTDATNRVGADHPPRGEDGLSGTGNRQADQVPGASERPHEQNGKTHVAGDWS